MDRNPENMPENTESEPTLEKVRDTITEAVTILFITKKEADIQEIALSEMRLARLGVSLEKYEHLDSKERPLPIVIIHDLVEQWIQKQGERKHEK